MPLQVYVSYGPKSSGELLLSYGFCPPAGTNPHDAFHLTVGLPPEDPHIGRKAELAQRYGLAAAVTAVEFPLRTDALPSQLLGFLALAAAQPAEEGQLDVLAAEVLGAEGGRPPPSDWQGQDLQAAALQRLVALCKAGLKGAPLGDIQL